LTQEVHTLTTREAEPKDRQLLIRAASSVVLQRDVSLSRRVYSWLLGTEEAPAAQMEYLKANGLELLAETLHVSFLFSLS
jgi:hypothetical protein